MPAFSLEVLADPTAVALAAVCDVDPSADRGVVADTVAAVASGRSTTRRLAQALLDRPSILTDGSSPAPRVAADLLLALRKLGVGVSAPRCATCAKELATFQRRGQDWYCSPCGRTPLPCAACGKVRAMSSRDRAGRPRCGSCPPEDGPDPLETVVDVVASVDPDLDGETVRCAINEVTSRAGQRRALAWALTDRPELLTGAGAQSPVPSVLRLIEALCQAGATRIVRPACPRCGRVVNLSKLKDGLRICRGCEARLRAVPCARCGALRPLRRAARPGHPRRARSAYLPQLFHARSRQPGDLYRLRAPPTGERALC